VLEPSQFIGVGLAEEHRTERAQAPYGRCIVWRNKALQNLAARGGRQTIHTDHVFDRQRNTEQRRVFTSGAAGIGLAGLRQRRFACEVQISMQLRIELIDAIENRLRSIRPK